MHFQVRFQVLAGGAGTCSAPEVRQRQEKPEVLTVAVPGVRSHCRFRKRGTEYVSESVMKRMKGRTKRQCDRAPAVPWIIPAGTLYASPPRMSTMPCRQFN